MSVLSDKFEEDLDISIWFHEDLDPMQIFLEAIWIKHNDFEGQLVSNLSDQLADQINKRIMERIKVKMGNLSGIL